MSDENERHAEEGGSPRPGEQGPEPDTSPWTRPSDSGAPSAGGSFDSGFGSAQAGPWEPGGSGVGDDPWAYRPGETQQPQWHASQSGPAPADPWRGGSASESAGPSRGPWWYPGGFAPPGQGGQAWHGSGATRMPTPGGPWQPGGYASQAGRGGP